MSTTLKAPEADPVALGVIREVIDPFDPLYGAPTDGVSDGTAAWLAANAAMDTAIAAGHSAELVLSKRLVLNPSVATTPVRIPPNTDGTRRRVFRGRAGGHAVLSANMPTLFQPGRTTDNQTFSALDFIDVAVDGNNVASPNDVLFGPYDAGTGGIGALAQRVNYRDVRFIRPRAWNVPAGGAGAPRRIIHLASRHVKTNEGDLNWNPGGKVQNSITGIRIEDARLDGGDFGIAIIGALQMGVTSGARIKNYAGTPTVINYSGLGSLDFVDGEWLHVGVGVNFERHQIVSHTNNGDGTGSVTLEAALTYTQPTEDGTGAGKGAPIAMGNICNVWHDDIVISGGYHVSGAGGYGSNIHLVGSGIGDRVTVTDFRGKGGGDNCIEIDTALTVNVTRCYMEDGANEQFFCRNYHSPQTQLNEVATYDQVHTFTDCTASIRDTEPTSSAPGWGWLPGHNWSNGFVVGPTPMFGTARWNRCKMISKARQLRTIQGRALRCWKDSSIRRLEGDITYVQDRIADATAGAPVIFSVSPCSDTYVGLQLACSLFGQAAGVSPLRVFEVFPYRLEGATSVDMEVDSDLEFRSSLSSVANGGHQVVQVGNYASNANVGTIHGRLGLKALPGWAGSDTTPKAFQFDSTLSVLASLRIDKCDLAKMPAGGIILNFLGSPPLAWMRKLRVGRNNTLIGALFNWTTGTNNPGLQVLSDGGGPQSYALTVAASPFVWINETGVDSRVSIYGGTGTDVEHSYDSGGHYDAAKLHSQASGTFPGVHVVVRPGEAIRTTYTVAPTMVATPIL